MTFNKIWCLQLSTPKVTYKCYVSVNDGDIPHIRKTEPSREHISSFTHVFFFKSNVHDALAVGIFVEAWGLVCAWEVGLAFRW